MAGFRFIHSQFHQFMYCVSPKFCIYLHFFCCSNRCPLRARQKWLSKLVYIINGLVGCVGWFFVHRKIDCSKHSNNNNKKKPQYIVTLNVVCGDETRRKTCFNATRIYRSVCVLCGDDDLEIDDSDFFIWKKDSLELAHRFAYNLKQFQFNGFY